MQSPNGMDRQPNEERLADAARYMKGKIKKKIKGKISLKARAILALILLIILIIFVLFFSFEVPDLQRQHSEQMADTIYEELEVESLIDFIEIKGDNSTGYYYGFVEGAEEKLDKLTKKLKRINDNIDKELLKKMIMADVVNQFPLLTGGSMSSGGIGGNASSYTGNTIAEKTWNFLIGQGFSEIAVAGLMGNIHQESGGFNPAIVENGGSGEGIGLIQWSFGRRDQLENYAASLGKHWSDVDVQLDFLLMELTPGGSQYANFQFIPSSAYEQWKNASTAEEAARIFSEAFERPGTPMMENRVHWAYVYYEQFKGTFSPSEDVNSEGLVQAFLEEAQKVADYVKENEFNYGNAQINPAIDDSEKLVSCDRYVGWVLYNMGFTDQPEKQGLTVHVLRDYCLDKGWEEINSVNELQAGDIVFSEYRGDPYGHTFICAGPADRDGYWIRYDCGSQERIRSQQPFTEPINGFTKAIRPNFSNASMKGEFQGTVRIRRVTPNKNIGEIKNTGTGNAIVSSNSTGAANEIQEYLEESATQGVWSVYAKNLNTNSVVVNIDNRKLQSASLIKLFIMATAYEEIEKGALNKSEVIDDIKIMINRSDNDATNRLIDKLGFSKINNYITTHSYNSTKLQRKMLESAKNGDNYTSVGDVGNLLESIYRGNCVSKDASTEMLDILKSQTLKSKIPAGVPSGVVTANKTGELSSVENDAAIVFKEGAPYVLVVMSNEINNTSEARNNIKEISSKVYNLMGTTSSSQGGTNANAKHKVAIVAGHGIQKHAGSYEEVANRTKWYTTGTSGKTPSGETWKEYQITKKVADYVEKFLAPYSSEVSVVQVGYSKPNWERMQLAKDNGVDSYVGIHFNSSENTSATGVSAYYRNGDSKSQSFADIFTKKVSEEMGLENKGVMSDSTSNNGKLESIGNASEWGFPSTLIEGGFMSNAKDMEVIGAENEEGLKKYARGIAEGILEYYGIENRGLDGINITGSTTSNTDGVNSKIYDLSYVSPEKFKELVESNSRRALYTYTLDEKTKKLIIANWSYTTEKGLEIKECSPINFRAVLNKYTMPIEYMIAFLVHTNDAELVSGLADLALDSEYVIAIQDNVNTVQTTVDIQEKKYLETRNSEGNWYVSEENFEDWHSVSKDIKVNETVSNEIELTYADSWFVKFFKTSSYSTMALTQASGNNLSATQGEYIGDFKLTVYCAGCNTPPGTAITASGVPATPNHTIAVHTEYFRGEVLGGKLAKGSQVVINGQVYTVEDTGDLDRQWIDNWIDIYTETPCENYAATYDTDNGTVPVYVATNVREENSTNSQEEQEEEQNDGTEDAEEENVDEVLERNRGLKGINTVANVAGKVTDTTNVMEESLNARYEEINNGMRWHIERKKITTVRTITNKYDSGKEEVESNEQKVIDVLLGSEGLIKHRFNIKWMESILEQNERTVNMIDLTRYLYNKAKDQLAGVQDNDEQYSFDVYQNNDLYRIYSSAGILEEFIKALENNPLRLYMSNHVSVDEGEIFDYITTEDEPSYKMLTNEYNGRGFGFNIFHRLNETDWDTGEGYEPRIVEHYDDLSVDIKKYVNMDQTLETSTVDQVMRKEIQKWKEKVEESLENKGIELEEYQIDALTTIAYEYGWSAKYAEEFVDAYNKYYLKDDKKAFREKFELPLLEVKPFWVDTSSRDKTEAEEKQNLRNQLVWNLFDTGKYKTPEGEILDPDSFHGGNGEFLDVAYEIWLEVCQRFTSYGGSTTPPSGTQIDCSGYVSWVLYQYGVVTGDDALVREFQGWQHTTESLKTVPWEQFGFEVIPVAAGQDVTSILQPGDILDRSVGTGASGHTQIIVEVKNHVVYTYDCGSASHWLGKNGEPYISNFASSDSRPGIIIRKK